jgi:hypothetical protein
MSVAFSKGLIPANGVPLLTAVIPGLLEASPAVFDDREFLLTTVEIPRQAHSQRVCFQARSRDFQANSVRSGVRPRGMTLAFCDRAESVVLVSTQRE